MPAEARFKPSVALAQPRMDEELRRCNLDPEQVRSAAASRIQSPTGATYIMRVMVINETGQLLMCESADGLCPIGGRIQLDAGTTIEVADSYAPAALEFMASEAGIPSYDPARFKPLPARSREQTDRDYEESGLEIAWTIAPVKAAEVASVEGRSLVWITAAHLVPDSAGKLAHELKYNSHLAVLQATLDPRELLMQDFPVQTEEQQETPARLGSTAAATGPRHPRGGHQSTPAVETDSQAGPRLRHKIYVAMVGVSENLDDEDVHVALPVSAAAPESTHHVVTFEVDVAEDEDWNAAIVGLWHKEFNRAPLGPIVHFQFDNAKREECCGAAVYDYIRNGDRSALDHYLQYRSVPQMLAQQEDAGFDWQDAFLHGWFEHAWLTALSTAFEGEGMSLADPALAQHLLSYNRTRRNWHRIRHSMLNQFEIGLALGGVLPHGWHRDLVGYSSLPTEKTRLVAEHFCLARFFRVLSLEKDESFTPVAIDGGTVEISNSADFIHGSGHNETASLPTSVRESLEGAGTGLRESIRLSKEMDAASGVPPCDGTPALDALNEATGKFVQRLSDHPAISPAIKPRWRSTRSRAGPENWKERPLMLELSAFKKQMAGHLGDETLHEVFEELGLSMDDSVIDDSDQHSASGVRFGDFVAGFERLVAQHGWQIRFFNVDDPESSHWTMVDRGVNLDVAKCKFCLRHGRSEMPTLCTGCMFPYHVSCAAAHAGDADALSPGICGNCAQHTRAENKFNNAMWTYYNELDRSIAIKLERTANTSGSAAWEQPASVFLGIMAGSVASLPPSQQGCVLRSCAAEDDAEMEDTEPPYDLSIFAAHESVSMRLLQTEDTPTGQLSVARLRRFFRTLASRRLHVDLDDLAVKFVGMPLHTGAEARLPRPGLVNNASGATVAAIYALDIQPSRLDSHHQRTGTVDWASARLTLPLPHARVVDPRSDAGVRQSCHDVGRMLFELGGVVTDHHHDFLSALRFFYDHYAATEAPVTQDASTYLSDLTIGDSDEEGSRPVPPPFSGIVQLSREAGLQLRKSIRVGDVEGRSSWTTAQLQSYRKFVFSFENIWRLGFVLAIDTSTPAVPLPSDLSTCVLATGHDNAVYVIEMSPSKKEVYRVAPVALTEYSEAAHKGLAGTQSADTSAASPQPAPEPPSSDSTYVLMLASNFSALLPNHVTAEMQRSPDARMHLEHKYLIPCSPHKGGFRGSDPRLPAARMVHEHFPHGQLEDFDLGRLRRCSAHVPPGSVLYCCVVTDTEFRSARLSIVHWDRTLDADGSVLPLARDVVPHLGMFGLHDLVESDVYPILSESWMRVMLRHTLRSYEGMDGFQPSARPHSDSADEDDDAEGGAISPPTSPPDLSSTDAAAARPPQTPANAGGAKGSVVQGTSQSQNQNPKMQTLHGISPIAGSTSPLLNSAPDATLNSEMSSIMQQQSTILSKLVDSVTQKSQYSDADQYFTLANGSRVKKVSIERAQSLLPGTIRQAGIAEYKAFTKDEEGNVAGEIFAKRAIITIFSHGLANDDATMKMAETASVAASLLGSIPKKSAHVPIADYIRRVWLARILEVCLTKHQTAATNKLLEMAGTELTKAWKQELMNRTRTADDTCKSDVVKFVCEHDETLQQIFGDEIPMFGHKTYIHAECIYFLCCRDNTLTESKRRDLEYNSRTRISIPSSMYMVILEGGAKVEPYADWLRRLKTEKARQKLVDIMAQDDDRTWAIKMLYACPSPIQDMFWDSHEQIVFDEESSWEEEWMRQEIRDLITKAKLLRNFKASPALAWGKPRAKSALPASDTKGGGQGAGGGKRNAKGGRQLNAAEHSDKGSTEQQLGVLQGYSQKGKGNKGKGSSKGSSKGKASKGKEDRPPLVPTDGRRDTPPSIENATGKPWSTSDCIPGKTQKAKPGQLHCDHPLCMKEALEFLQRNPGKPESSASTFNHLRLACPFEINDRVKLSEHPDVENARHAANIIRNKHRTELMEFAFGKGSKYNRINGKQRSPEAHKELRTAQREAGLFNKTQSK